MKNFKTRSAETIALGVGAKYGVKILQNFWPYFRILISLILVRLGLKKNVRFSMKYINVASKWSDQLGFKKKYRYTYSFPTPIHMHRAIGIPEVDNSKALTVMDFVTK